jgi:hypothetical protein
MRERERERCTRGHKSSHVSVIWGQSKRRWALKNSSHGGREGGREENDSYKLPFLSQLILSLNPYIFPPYADATIYIYPLYIYIYISFQSDFLPCNSSTSRCLLIIDHGQASYIYSPIPYSFLFLWKIWSLINPTLKLIYLVPPIPN